MEDDNNDRRKHHSEDGNFIKDFDGWSNKSDPDGGRQQCRDSNTSKGTCELGKTVKQDGLDAWELCSREINVKVGDTGGWGTWGMEDGQSAAAAAAAAWKHGIRDANVTKKENIRETTVEMTTPDPWKQHPRHGNGKKGQDGAAAWNHDIRDDNARRLKNGREETVNLTTPDLWKQHTRHGNDKKGFDAWDEGLDKKSNPDLWKHHSRDASKRESDGRGKASYNSVKKEIDRWATRGSADSQDGADAWNHDISDHNAKRAKNGSGKPFAHTTSDPLKLSDRDSIVKHVTDSWDKQLDKKSNPEVRKHHSRNGSVDRMNDDTGRTPVRLSRSPDRRSSAHDRSGKDSWKHDYRYRSDTYRRTTVSKSPNRRSAHDKSGKDLWKHDNRDWCDNYRRTTVSKSPDRQGSSHDKNRKDSWKHDNRDWYDNYRRTTVSKSPDRRGSAHDKNGKDSWKHDNREMSDSSRRTAARSSKSPDRRVSDALKQHYKEGNMKTETAGSDRRVSTHDKSGKNTGMHHDRDEIDNYRKKTARLGKSPHMPVSDARKQHYEEGNVKTETAGSEYVTRGTDRSSKAIGISDLYSSKQHGEGNTNRETDGWGKATGWSDPDASRQHSVVGYTKKETGEWGNVKREADGVGKSSDMSHLDSSKPHGGNCNVERKTDGLGGSPDRCDPVVSRQHNGEGNVAEETDGWSKAPDTDVLDSLKQYDEGWAKAAGEDAPDTWEQCSKEANIGKDPLGWGNAKCETDGWGKAPDTSVLDSSKKHGGEGNDKRVTDGWSKAVSEDVPNVWEQCSKEANIKKETLGWGTWDAFQGKIGPNTWNHHARDHNVKSDDGWGKPPDQMDRNHWNDAKKETDGWSKSPNQFCPGKPDRLSCSISQDSGPNRDRGRWPPVGSKRGRDNSCRTGSGGSSVVCRQFAAGYCRWGSQCRFFHEDPGSGSFGTAISEGRGSAAVCRQFVAGQCKWGSQCRFLHEDRGTGSFDTDITESRGSAAVCRQFAAGLCRWGSQCRYLHEDHGAGRVQNDGLQGQTNGEDMSEGTKRASSCFDFLKGRCHRDPECKFAYHDASYVMDLDKTCDGPGLAGQATSDNASNSSHLMSRDCSVVAAATGTAQPMEGIDFIHTPLVYRAESCASTFQHSSEIGTDRMMLDGDSSHMMPSKMDPSNKNEEKLVELGKMDGAGIGHSKKEQGPCPTNVSVSTDVTTSIIKDDHVKKFKFALTEYVKVILKPIWKEGRVSKEVHNLIVKKAVAKVISIVPGPNIPRTPVQIEQYLSFSETKLKKLVQGYLDLYLKPEPVPGKT